MRRAPRNSTCRAGFTLVEVLIAFTVLVLLGLNTAMVTKAGRSATRAGMAINGIDDELHLTLDRISLVLMAARSDDVEHVYEAPLPSSFVRYQTSLGTQDGMVIRGPVEDIEFVPTGEERGKIQWSELHDEDRRRSVVWSKNVPAAYQAEVLRNLKDDNRNDLLDEAGLAFTKTSDTISVHVTVERVDSEGHSYSTHKRSLIKCRN